MNQSQEDHLRAISFRFVTDLDKKFRAGAKEHGGDLRDMTPLQLLRCAKDEVLDQWVYLDTLEEKLRNENGKLTNTNRQ